ncbi:MAG: cache domain-containing sensor histidine kinase [Omnitrophica WOR_2 bacterium]
MHPAYSLRARLMIFYLLIFLVPAAIMMTAMPYYYQKSLSSETRTITEGTLTSIARNIETYLDDLNRLTIAPYLNDDVMQALRLKNSPNYATADEYSKIVAIRALKTSLPLFLQNSREDILTTILVFPDNTSFVASAGAELSGPVADYRYTQQDWYRRAVEADGQVVFISSHPQDYLSSTPRQQVFSVARLIKDPDTHQPLGVVMADADTVVLARIVSDINFNVSSIACIFDNENKLLYSSKPLSADLQQQVWKNDGTIRSGGNSYVPVSQLIAPTQWKVVVLLSNSEILAKTRWLYITGILFTTGGLLLTFLLFSVLSRGIVHPFQEMMAVMKQVQTGNLQARFSVTGNDEISELGKALNKMIERLNQLIEHEYKAIINLRNAENRALQSQIQPHFLYNTLNGFIGLNRLKDTAGLEKAIFALSGMLHYTLEGDEWVTLEDEIAFVQKYCDLQRIRFRDRLTVDIDCDTALKSMKVPKLLLQPLVENAIIHGVEPAGRPCRLTVKAENKSIDGGSWAQIIVQDTGTGFNPETLQGKAGVGLANVRERLTIAFHDSTFSVSSLVNAGTRIVIEIPLELVAVP